MSKEKSRWTLLEKIRISLFLFLVGSGFESGFSWKSNSDPGETQPDPKEREKSFEGARPKKTLKIWSLKKLKSNIQCVRKISTEMTSHTLFILILKRNQ